MNAKRLISTGIVITASMVLAICWSAPAFAVSTVTTSSAGDGVFLLQGIGIESAAALEINIVYDTSALANPRVVEGPLIAGAMTAINPNVPGTVRMVIVRLSPVNGSGVIATLTFDRTGSSPGRIIALSARLADIKGALLSSLVQVNNPSETAASTTDSSQGQNTASSASMPATTPGTPGTPTTAPAPVIIAAPSTKTEESKAGTEAEKGIQPGTPEFTGEGGNVASLPARRTDEVPASGDTTAAAKMPESKIFMQISVLDRFKEYRGKSTPEAFISLFEQDNMFWCRQDPPVALSDGKTVVRVTFITTPGNKTSSDIAVMGARLISMKKDPDNTNTWVVELLPEKGEYRASLAVSQGDVKMVYPLTIAPKLNMYGTKAGAMTGADFYRYFEKRGTAPSTAFDVNNDDKRDYIDDYTITANYLAGTRTAQHQKSN
jgi:hypothetical protein